MQVRVDGSPAAAAVKRVVLFAVSTLTIACASTPRQSTPSTSTASAPARPTADTQTRIRITRDGFTTTSSDSAVRGFVPDAHPVDTGGLCNVRRTGNGSTSVSASFDDRDTTGTTMTVWFDSVGHLVRFADVWGGARVRPPVGATRAQIDSSFNARVSKRSTSITLDWSIDQALVINSGGGKPTVAVTSSVRTIESLPQLGPPTKRIQFIRRLCGV